jgi:hypothetical protein
VCCGLQNHGTAAYFLCGPVAQLVRAADLDSAARRFDPYPAHPLSSTILGLFSKGYKYQHTKAITLVCSIWSNGEGNMDGKEQAIQYLTQKKKELTEKMDKMMRPIQELQQEIAALSTSISLLFRDDTPTTPGAEVGGFPLRKIRNMTQTQALIEIAKYNGGTIKSLDVKPILIAAKLMKHTKNAAHMVNGAITRSEAFDRIGRGEYRLKELNLKLEVGDTMHVPN